MKKIVLDTNCLLISLPKRSPYRIIWDLFLSGKFILCISNEILQEYWEILSDKINAKIAGNAEYLVSNDTHFNILRTIPFPKVHIINLKTFKEEMVGVKLKGNIPYWLEDTDTPVLNEREIVYKKQE